MRDDQTMPNNAKQWVALVNRSVRLFPLQGIEGNRKDDVMAMARAAWTWLLGWNDPDLEWIEKEIMNGRGSWSKVGTK